MPNDRLTGRKVMKEKYAVWGCDCYNKSRKGSRHIGSMHCFPKDDSVHRTCRGPIMDVARLVWTNPARGVGHKALCDVCLAVRVRSACTCIIGSRVRTCWWIVNSINYWKYKHAINRKLSRAGACHVCPYGSHAGPENAFYFHVNVIYTAGLKTWYQIYP